MSGGHFDYNQYKIDQIACDIEQMIRNNNSTEKDEWGYDVGYKFSPETIQRFKIAVSVLKLAYIYAQRVDWLVSGDDSEESFHKRLDEDITKHLKENDEQI
jgi:hypothetical protein